jgi:hypothetical protein
MESKMYYHKTTLFSLRKVLISILGIEFGDKRQQGSAGQSKEAKESVKIGAESQQYKKPPQQVHFRLNWPTTILRFVY